MNRPVAFRAWVLASLLVPGLALVGASLPAEAQGYRLEKQWKCARCGGFLGNSVSRPTYCHHCDAKRKSSSSSSSPSSSSSSSLSSYYSSNSSEKKDKMPPMATIILVGLGVLAAAGLVLYIMNSGGNDGNARA